jgi:hypothetical protein
LTTNLGKHDFIIVTTKAAVPAGVVSITISALTMGPITERKEDGFKVSQDDTAIDSAFVPALPLTSQLYAALSKFAASFTALKFNENMGIESSGAYVIPFHQCVFVTSCAGTCSGFQPPSSSAARWPCWPSAPSAQHLLAVCFCNILCMYPPNSMMVFFICSIYTTIASVAYLSMALGEGKLKEANITRSLDNKFYVQSQIKLPVVFYPRYFLQRPRSCRLRTDARAGTVSGS